MKKNSGFTLIELLVAVGLMVILMTAIVLIFYRATDVMKINDARINIYENARSAMDILENDIKNSVPVVGGQQRMYIADYNRPVAGIVPAGTNADGAADYIGLVTVTTTPAGAGATATRELKTVYVEYFLTTDDDAETSFTGKGYTTSQRSARKIFVLKRRIWALPTLITTLQTQQTVGVPIFNAMPGPLVVTSSLLPPGPSPATMTLIEDGDLCHWIVSFNIECLNYNPAAAPGPTNPKYYELTESGNVYVKGVMPLGDAVGVEPVTPRKMRISLRVIDGAGERQE
ncbi:MAG: type II secretion system GspH family protein, partial [Planctomycetes bacterium]|nr:type II secretion system GspH family protein [Planctomycetota bacterium]